MHGEQLAEGLLACKLNLLIIYMTQDPLAGMPTVRHRVFHNEVDTHKEDSV